ncbi:DUF3907 family protein [Bacillus massiliglaciei]|uniref:DUF3907 family protein n=1 Tax=Bacillus massiliglaciei TaxID=1816693 RepID=UPI000A86712B|nr:DUF3907 family protein [Bacillus massiliglaciei]
MGNAFVKSQLEDVQSFLEETVAVMESYLNEATYSGLQKEQQGEAEYYKGLLSSLRRLLVNCEAGLEACRSILKSEIFHQSAAEKTLYRIYHQCIEDYFSPKSDLWYEDSRASYTGQNLIKFHGDVPDSLEAVLKELENGFQAMREDLEYYETDYRTKMMQSR